LNFYSVYQKIAKLGEGGFGEVYQVRHKIINTIRAMKELLIINCQNGKEETNTEIEILKSLDHPNIIKLFEYFSDKEKYYLITEYCKEGDLSQIMRKQSKMPEEEAGYIMYQIFKALVYCHKRENPIIHRDIKLENIVASKKNDKNLYDIKLIDFGISKILKNPENETQIKGSLYYIAPEVLTKKYDEKCDIWSSGVVFFKLVTGKFPFEGKSRIEIWDNIKNCRWRFPEKIAGELSSEVCDLISKCLVASPKERISAEQAISHPFFKRIKEDFVHVNETFLIKTINNIKKYESKNQLQAVTFLYLVHNFPELDEITRINKVFHKFNTSGTGKLTEEELIKGINKYLYKGERGKNTSNKEGDKIFRKLDVNGNGYIDCEEFVRAGIDKKLLKDRDKLKFTFDFIDKNKNGQISFDELKIICNKDEKALELIQQIDKNSDKLISFEEYYNMMLKIIEDDIKSQ
jgi:calcium-dependent protein kinase